MTAVMSAANEKAVEVFLAERIRYLDIVPLVSACCEAHQQARQQPLCCFPAELRRRVQTRSALPARVLLQCQNDALCFLRLFKTFLESRRQRHKLWACTLTNRPCRQ